LRSSATLFPLDHASRGLSILLGGGSQQSCYDYTFKSDSEPQAKTWCIELHRSGLRVPGEREAVLAQPRILLADDHHPILERVLSVLQPHFEVIGMVNNGRTLLSEAHRLQPDVIVLDIAMPLLTGIEAARELHKAGSQAKLVFLTIHQDPAFVRECFAEGGLGYVTKSRLVTDLIPAIHEALSDHTFVSPSILR
jgi:CheY-like chemotaxis protein